MSVEPFSPLRYRHGTERRLWPTSSNASLLKNALEAWWENHRSSDLRYASLGLFDNLSRTGEVTLRLA